MNEIVAKEPPSIIQDMAARFGMDKRAFEATLKATVVPANTSNEQFAAFLLVAKHYNLNPITKEIYAFPAKGGGIQPIVGIDGWCNIINSHPQLDGIEFDDIKEDGKLTAIACKIFRKDRSHPIIAIEYMKECTRATEPWKQWPARMLRHKALIQAARYAFGFSGIVDPDEADRMVDVTPKAFNNDKTRQAFVTEVLKDYETAEALDELLAAKDKHAKKMHEVIMSDYSPDIIAAQVISQGFDKVEARIKREITQDVKTYHDIAASFGEGFAEVNDRPSSFDATELPADETVPRFLGRGAA